jgi:hypothetical protein
MVVLVVAAIASTAHNTNIVVGTTLFIDPPERRPAGRRVA